MSIQDDDIPEVLSMLKRKSCFSCKVSAISHILEGVLPQLFYLPKQDLPSSMDKTSKVLAVSHIPPFFHRLFPHKVSGLGLESATNIKESPTYCPKEIRASAPSPT
ncbi:hypothetical protein Ancab_020214 [Ancistrocladus abbreviatus]